MGLHTDTQIYASYFELLRLAGKIVMNMQRNPKKLFGEKIIDACIALDIHLRAANMAQDKTPHLLAFAERLEVIELLTRICRDDRYISLGQYADLVDFTQSIGRQATGWRKSLTGSTQQPSLFPGG